MEQGFLDFIHVVFGWPADMALNFYSFRLFHSASVTFCVALPFCAQEVDGGVVSSPRIVMTSSDEAMDPWEDRQVGQVNAMEVSLQREQQALRSEASRLQSLENRRRSFVEEYHWEDQDTPSVI